MQKLMHPNAHAWSRPHQAPAHPPAAARLQWLFAASAPVGCLLPCGLMMLPLLSWPSFLQVSISNGADKHHNRRVNIVVNGLIDITITQAYVKPLRSKGRGYYASALEV